MSRRVDFEVPEKEPRLASCRSCGADMVWHRTSTGKSMPLDWASRVAEGDGWRMESHHAHCPNAKRHRKPKGGSY